jgi:hypothetical protein
MKNRRYSAPELTLEEIAAKYKAGVEGNYAFDFSRVSGNDFELVLKVLVKSGKTQIRSLTFSLDMYSKMKKSDYPMAKFSKNQNSKMKLSAEILQNSAFKKNPNTMHSLLLSLSHILPKTEFLTSLNLKALLLKSEQLEELSLLLKKCTTLQVLTLESIPIYDINFPPIAAAVKKQGLVEFHCVGCGLSDKSTADIKSILNFHLSIQREADWQASLELDGFSQSICLKVLDLRRNNFTQAILSELDDILRDIPLTELDLSNNYPIDERFFMRAQKNLPHLNIKVDALIPTQRPKTPARTPSITSRPPHSTPAPLPEGSIPQEYLNDEEDDGKDELVTLGPGVKIIGPRAREFANYIQTLGDLLEKIHRERKNGPLKPPMSKRAESVSHRMKNNF